MYVKISDNYYNSVIVTKYRKANAYEHFRTLNLLTYLRTLASEMLTKIINRRIKREVENYLTNDQYGFSQLNGTKEAISGLCVLIEKQIERNKVTYVLDFFFGFRKGV